MAESVDPLRKRLPAWSEVGRRRRARRHTPCVPIAHYQDRRPRIFHAQSETVLSSDIMHIASNPQEYSDFVGESRAGCNCR